MIGKKWIITKYTKNYRDVQYEFWCEFEPSLSSVGHSLKLRSLDKAYVLEPGKMVEYRDSRGNVKAVAELAEVSHDE